MTWHKARAKDLVRGAVIKLYGADQDNVFDSPFASATIVKTFSYQGQKCFKLVRPTCWGTPAVLSGDVGCHMFEGHEFDLTVSQVLEKGLVWLFGNKPELHLVKSPLLGHEG